MGRLTDKFIARLRSIYKSQKARAKKYGQTIPYTADELVTQMLPLVGAPCPYCRAKLTPKGFQLDHIQPIARGGSWELLNVRPVCTSCNRRKHALTHNEYDTLLRFLFNLELHDPLGQVVDADFMRQNIFARLAAGGAWLASRY